MAQKVKNMNKKEQDLLKDITIMMTDPNQATNEKKITEIMKKIRHLKPPSTADQLRLAACHFMTMYHTRKAMSIGMPQDPNGGGMDQQALMQQQAMLGGGGGGAQMDNAINIQAVEKFKQEQRKDMELGWQFLNINGEDEQANKTARVLKIEVAQRLENSVLLAQAFEDLLSNKLSQEETMVAFTAAPFLGDWEEMMNLGKKIEQMPGGLEQLHMMSLQLPIPDFSLIYELAKEYNLGQSKKPDVETLTWDLFNVSKIRVKFKDVDCGEYEEKRQELMDEITKQGEIEWEDVPNVSHVHIKRMGALCQAVSFGEVPMMLNGPWFDDKIHVKGRAEMPLMPENEQEAAQMNQMNQMNMNMENMTILIQEEEWKLTKDVNNLNLYKGEYYLKQRPDLPPNKQRTSEHAPVNMTFNIEIYINKQNMNELQDNKANDEEDEMIDEKMENEDDDENVEDVSKHNKKNKHHNKNKDKINNNNNNNSKEEVKHEETEKITTEFDGLELD